MAAADRSGGSLTDQLRAIGAPTTSQGGLLRVLERLDEFMGLVAEARCYCSALGPHG